MVFLKNYITNLITCVKYPSFIKSSYFKPSELFRFALFGCWGTIWEGNDLLILRIQSFLKIKE